MVNKHMRYTEFSEAAGVGKVVPGVNTTADVQPGELRRQAAKFGFNVDDHGKPGLVMESVNVKAAQKFLLDISPAIANSKVNEVQIDEDGGIGATVAFVAVFLGGVEVANVGPLDVRGGYEMERAIEADIARSYETTHPEGYVDPVTGNVYQIGDWEVNVETCHSSECSDIVGPRMDAIKARQAARDNQ